MKSILIFFFIPLVKEVKSKEYNGYFFQDNLLQGSVMYSESHFCKICLERFGPENGHATLNTGTAIPRHVTKHTEHIYVLYLSSAQVSLCFKIFIDYIRFGGQVGVVEILRLGELNPSLSLLCR